MSLSEEKDGCFAVRYFLIIYFTWDYFSELSGLYITAETKLWA